MALITKPSALFMYSSGNENVIMEMLSCWLNVQQYNIRLLWGLASKVLYMQLFRFVLSMTSNDCYFSIFVGVGEMLRIKAKSSTLNRTKHKNSRRLTISRNAIFSVFHIRLFEFSTV